MLYIPVARASVVTGRTLVGLLRERGIRTTVREEGADAGVSYGVHIPTPRTPFLNHRACAGNKFTQFQMMANARVTVPRFRLDFNAVNGRIEPTLGRSFHHHGGTDIKLYLQRSDLRRRGPSDFYVEFIPSDTEFRHWIYRGRHLGTYEKVLAHPKMNRHHRVGRNYDNGYAFELVRQERLVGWMEQSIEQAKLAVAALGLDFGAVDVLAGEDGRPYVLEVNTGPGVEGANRQVIQGLADKIVRWVQLGYPRRRGDNEQ